ncbi:MAG: ferrous iron transporter [Euryarchaeota archaeon]|nr:ferrous iron transporter [Euryarchaeota archaeon]
MLGQFVITFREAFEAMLLVAILVMYLRRTGREAHVRSAVYGAFGALVAGALIAGAVALIYGGLGEGNKELFEGVASLLAVVVLTYMVYWMATRGSEIHREVERKISSSRSHLAVALAAFIFVVREVIETVLFLTPFAARDAAATATGAIAGVLMAAVLSYGIFSLGMRFPLRRFFYYSSIMLVLIAGGLAGYGTHELLEYAEEQGYELGWLAEPAYNLGIGSDSPLHHKGVIGSIFAVLFGYTVKAEWLRVIVHAAYLAVALPAVHLAYASRRKKQVRGMPAHG